MNTFPHDPIESGSASHPVDATLHLIAHAPVPDGLEERVHARLRSTPRKGVVLAWPVRLGSDWMRSAAAAAIVAVVAGGGWGVYSNIGRPRAAKVIVRPAAGAANGGFSSAGAMRTPATLNGPVLKHTAKSHAGKLAKKADSAPVAGQDGQTDATEKPLQPSADAASK